MEESNTREQPSGSAGNANNDNGPDSGSRAPSQRGQDCPMYPISQMTEIVGKFSMLYRDRLRFRATLEAVDIITNQTVVHFDDAYAIFAGPSFTRAILEWPMLDRRYVVFPLTSGLETHCHNNWNCVHATSMEGVLEAMLVQYVPAVKFRADISVIDPDGDGQREIMCFCGGEGTLMNTEQLRRAISNSEYAYFALFELSQIPRSYVSDGPHVISQPL
ncbi:hypothetical protein F4778DRAFT_779737 [Xylariomycetidae sp. FL2044]|nr:hypothetical protein F4778DRAFT_779737 [Xylariomycetidae sp. FL2044]